MKTAAPRQRGLAGNRVRGDTVPGTMLAARLHGPRDLRLERVPHPGSPGVGKALIRVMATGICGSDLHSYQDARIGDTPIQGPLILGHEFAGIVEAVGPDAMDGCYQPLQPGTRVAVDPAQPCGRCEGCEHGHPNLCRRLHFCGNYPDGGSLCEWIHMPARSCFPIPRSMDFETAALLEPLGVALHAVDLARIRIGSSVVIVGAGPIGLLILQLARLSGADPVFLTDSLPWRLALGKRWGAVPMDRENAIERVLRETNGRGVDVAIEAAWGDESIADAAEMTRLGGRLVLVGIPSEDRLTMKHSTARRKGLTILLSRRMKHVYPRAIQLVKSNAINWRGMVTHRFPLRKAADALALNAAYKDRVVKVVVMSGRDAALK
jgi:L-iditol 2-dehydrogenase